MALTENQVCNNFKIPQNEKKQGYHVQHKWMLVFKQGGVLQDANPELHEGLISILLLYNGLNLHREALGDQWGTIQVAV